MRKLETILCYLFKLVGNGACLLFTWYFLDFADRIQVFETFIANQVKTGSLLSRIFTFD